MRGTIIPNGRRVWAGVAALAALAIAAVGHLSLEVASPAPLPADAPDGAFSAGRAMQTLEDIAAEPRPLGSASSDQVRDDLAEDLDELGFDVDIESGLGGASFESEATFGRVDNVVATLPGSDPSGRVLLVSHYDSVAAGPGAADAGMQVASIMETARALADKGKPKNDIVVLFTDGEESGLLGAEAYTRAHPSRGNDLVLNWEARGTSGPSLMFETSPGDARMVETYASVAPHTSGESSIVELYRYMPNDTDFTHFKATGYQGLNSANAETVARYHTPQDSVDNVDRATVQHHGENMLALASAFGDTDLKSLKTDENLAYSHLFGVMVTPSVAAGIVMALLSLGLSAATIVLARRRRLLSLPRWMAAFASVPLPLIGAAALGQALWSALAALVPGMADSGGHPYRLGIYAVALVLVTAVAVLTWYLSLRRWAGPAALALGASSWMTLLAVASAVFTPGSAFGVVLPALGAAAGALAALVLRNKPLWTIVVVAVGLIPAVTLMSSTGRGLLVAFGLSLGGVATAVFALTGVLLTPLLETFLRDPAEPRRRFGWATPVVVLATAVAVTAGATVFTGFDAQHPRRAFLSYLMDADTGQARWVTTDVDPAQWTSQYASQPGAAKVPEWYRHSGLTLTHSGPAPVIDAPAPAAQASRKDGEVRVHVETRRDAYSVTLVFGAGVTAVTAQIPGEKPVEKPLDAKDTGGVVTMVDIPREGVDFRLETKGAPDLAVLDTTLGLDEVDGFRARPDGLMRTPIRDSDSVLVGRELEYRD